MIEKTEKEIREKLGDAVYGVDDLEMEEIVGALLKQRRLNLLLQNPVRGVGRKPYYEYRR